ncbi:MAG TPA: EscU/YscU/HrcU family type III secretion system export apparatus switch protein, partial [Chthoniobacteraceae bacterium]|nr:EscU/YscU/HrcU family type III secretion system export apparatus switch protein [Chthoniobacteraceae bacterium]
TGLAYLGLAGADYFWQYWEFSQQLRMSREELKQEMKNSEGDPLLKQRMRSMARNMARRQMFRDVPKADVVIVNPTHRAIALEYDPLKAPAPIVLAMGQRKVAERIKKIALEHGVPVIENRPLAVALVTTARVGMMIPAELYVAVAEILAFVIRQRNARGMRRAYQPISHLVGGEV